LPTNPVDFEQREGRLNRYNNFMIRQNLVLGQKNEKYELKRGEMIWDKYFDNAHRFSHRNDRYNLEMSPNWVFTPVKGGSEVIKFNRHVLDLPCSNDYSCYDRLMQDLDLYRLALGQPNQKKFMDTLRQNPYFSEIDVRGVILNFFPFKSRNRSAEIKKILDSEDEVRILIKDCIDYLEDIKSNPLASELKAHVLRHITRVETYLNNGQVDKEKFESSIWALYYFVDPFDELSDRDPEIGFEDDLEVLKKS